MVVRRNWNEGLYFNLKGGVGGEKRKAKMLNTAYLVESVWKCYGSRHSFPVTLNAPFSISESSFQSRRAMTESWKEAAVTKHPSGTSGPLYFPFNPVPNLWCDPKKPFALLKLQLFYLQNSVMSAILLSTLPLAPNTQSFVVSFN